MIYRYEITTPYATFEARRYFDMWQFEVDPFDFPICVNRIDDIYKILATVQDLTLHEFSVVAK